MSLLMDALKKAELAKRQVSGESAGASPEAQDLDGLALEPMADANSASEPAATGGNAEGQPLSLASHLEELDARFLAEAAAAARLKTAPSAAAMDLTEPRPVPSPADIPSRPAIEDNPQRPLIAPPIHRAPAEPQAIAQEKASAQNLFAAKQPENPPSRKAFAIAIGFVTVLSVLGIGGYFWWQLQPQTSLIARGPLSPAAPPKPVSAIAPTPAAAAPAPTAAVQPPSATSAGAPPASRPPLAQQDDDDEPVAAARPTRAPQRRATPQAAEFVEADSPIRISRAPLRVNPSLLRGFDAFNRGELALAQVEYERARTADPRNTDALHGLAAIAVRQGRLEQAEMLYRRITEADPQDTVAIAALLNQRGNIDPNTTESRLKSLAAAQPELAAPHLSLGNLYARHGRWADAQQAYFRAYSAEPDNPDILYNLAISLEHLRQNKLAAQYYGQAIAAAQTRPAGFDKAQVAARLQKLQP